MLWMRLRSALRRVSQKRTYFQKLYLFYLHFVVQQFSLPTDQWYSAEVMSVQMLVAEKLLVYELYKHKGIAFCSVLYLFLGSMRLLLITIEVTVVCGSNRSRFDRFQRLGTVDF